MDFKIIPYEGAGKIRFGMSEKEVEAALGIKPEKFKKFEDDEFETDHYKWCQVFYKQPGVCEAIEFFLPATVTFQGTTLLGKPYEKVKEIIEKYDNSLEYDETGFTSIKFGFGVYSPYAESEPSEPIEGVIVFEENYYNN
ncbi:hypothetical protein M3204_18335 [Mesobacillus subterraneus]|uniref:hypothetical protein n=1 Tax=Mesobacillus subterraneus TaxID=285983 RepID=UPI00204042D6|nr:hypothetical protein [Mesobacillus subterraneus]MCM3666381.1 hypothetical protein [Mesobacillus subterraneus]MCM3685347.1 hypothetical protein [Mesobacillus subterraneus]